MPFKLKLSIIGVQDLLLKLGIALPAIFAAVLVKWTGNIITSNAPHMMIDILLTHSMIIIIIYNSN